MGINFQNNQVPPQKRDNPKFPNKCDICAFKHSYDGKEKVTEQNLRVAARLAQEAGLAKTIAGSHEMEDGEKKSFYCVLGNEKNWDNKKRVCRDWQLLIPSSELTLGDHLVMHDARISSRVSDRLTALTIIVVVGTLLAILI